MLRSVKALDEILGGIRASLKAAENFIEKVAAGQIKRTDKDAADKKVWRRFI
jgi:hypothetical protein